MDKSQGVLADAEIERAAEVCRRASLLGNPGYMDFARAIEAAALEKVQCHHINGQPCVGANKVRDREREAHDRAFRFLMHRYPELTQFHREWENSRNIMREEWYPTSKPIPPGVDFMHIQEAEDKPKADWNVRAQEPDGASDEPTIVAGPRVGGKYFEHRVQVKKTDPKQFVADLNCHLAEARRAMIRLYQAEYQETLNNALGLG